VTNPLEHRKLEHLQHDAGGTHRLFCLCDHVANMEL
jgi:hypothetical protein